MTNNTLHEGHGPVRADGDRRGAVAAGLRRGHERASLPDDEFKIHFEKLPQIYKIAVGQFGALAVEGCKLAQGTKST